jgi:hypothetical protein
MRGATRIYHFFVFESDSVVVGHITAKNKNFTHHKRKTDDASQVRARRVPQMYQMLRIAKFL